MKSEGFWRLSESIESGILHADLPFPIAQKQSWENRDIFLSKLVHKESIAKKIAYRGYSSCRLCNKRNGYLEYEYGGWRWPEGLSHYVEEHNVKPSDDFIAFITTDN
jgi:hypothetical protein